ncbi:MAG: glutathione binding-like protein, partial [Burkholderiales bacterium]
TGKLLPAKLAERAEAIKWLMFEVANMCPMTIELYHYMLSDTGDFPANIFQRYKDKLTSYCRILDRQLENRDYLCHEYSIADIALYPWTAILEDMAGIAISDYPQLQRWIATMERRKAVMHAT